MMARPAARVSHLTSEVVAIRRSGRGRWYETTAIPEIRDQAAALARVLVATQALAGSGSAA